MERKIGLAGLGVSGFLEFEILFGVDQEMLGPGGFVEE